MFANTNLHLTSQCHDVTLTLIAIQCDSLCTNCQFLKTGLVDHIGGPTDTNWFKLEPLPVLTHACCACPHQFTHAEVSSYCVGDEVNWKQPTWGYGMHQLQCYLLYFQEPEITIPVLTKINLHGAVLLQHLLQFGNPRLVTTSFLDMKGISIKNLACDAHGSFVFDTIVNSRTVGEKTRESLISKLKVCPEYCILTFECSLCCDIPFSKCKSYNGNESYLIKI